MSSLLTPKRIALLFVGLGIVALLFIALSDGGAQWLTAPPPPRKGRLAFLGSWAGPVRAQWSRLKQRLLGAPKLVDVQGSIFEFDPTAPLPSLPASATTLTNESGAKVFIVPDGRRFEDQIKKSPSFHMLSGSRLMTADGMQGQIASYERVPVGFGTNRTLQNVGWWLDIWPHAGARRIELDCFLTATELAIRPASPDGPSAADELFLRTNIAVGARVKVPTNGCLFLIVGRTNQNGKAVGALLSPKIWQTK